jgi:hypothetical protein
MKIILNESQLNHLIKEKRGIDYDVYHETYTSAINSALQYANDRGYEYDDNEVAQAIGFGPRKPDIGKYNRFTITLYKNDKQQRKALQIQVYGMETGYELNAYIN